MAIFFTSTTGENVYSMRVSEDECSVVMKPVGCNLFVTDSVHLEFYDREWRKIHAEPGVWQDAKYIEYITNYSNSGFNGFLRFTDGVYVTNVKCRMRRTIDVAPTVGKVVVFSIQPIIYTQLITFNLSRITHLILRNVKIEKLRLVNCVSLRSLVCSDSGIAAIDLTACTFLKHLQCYGNVLRELDARASMCIETIDCANNELTIIRLNARGDVSSLNCLNNKLGNLNFGCTSIHTLIASRNPLGPEIRFTGQWKITNLIVSSCALVKITLPRSVEKLDVSLNVLTVLEYTGNLTTLDCSFNRIKYLRMVKSMIHVNCCFNNIVAVKLSMCKKLKTFTCNNNEIVKLVGLRRLTELNFLDCRYNSLPTIDIPGCVQEAK